jgi:hypothetical protein
MGAEDGSIDQEGSPDQIHAGFASDGSLAVITTEPSCRACEIVGNSAKAKGITGRQSRIGLDHQP